MRFEESFKPFFCFFLFVFLILPDGYSQGSIEQYIKDSAITIQSINPDDTLFADLHSLGKAIGDSRIVMLGEQDHGDGNTFLAKCRLVKYLHEQLGFNVLAFESDFYSLNKVWYPTGTSVVQMESAITNNVLRVWSLCKQFKPMINYLTAQHSPPQPLYLTGFDNQLVGEYSVLNLSTDIRKIITTSKIPFSENEERLNRLTLVLDAIYKFFRSGKYIKSDSNKQLFSELNGLVDTILQQVSLAAIKPDSFAMQMLWSLKSFGEEMMYGLNNDHFLSDSIRDKQMADNLRWLIDNKYTDQKIIVWAANAHVLKSNADLLKKKFAKPSSMGKILTTNPTVEGKTYVIGFTGLQGQTGLITTKRNYTIPKAEKHSVENWFAEKSFNYGFVDLKRFRKSNPAFVESFYMRYSHWLSAKLPWHTIYDGVFYIRDMAPCH